MATVSMPSSRHARMTRTAISPRLATRIFLNSFAFMISLLPGGGGSGWGGNSARSRRSSPPLPAPAPPSRTARAGARPAAEEGRGGRRGAGRLQHGGQLVRDLWTGGAHLDEHLAAGRLQPAVHLAQRGGVVQDAEDDVRRGGRLGGGGGHTAGAHRAGALGRAVPEGELEAGIGELAGDRGAHRAGAQEGDVHSLMVGATPAPAFSRGAQSPRDFQG